MKNIAILGSTGSIGTQAIDVITQHPDDFAVTVLSANDNAALLIEQARQVNPQLVVIANESKYTEVKTALADLPIEVLAGEAALADAMELPDTELVLTALVGAVGLRPTIRAIACGKDIALANKETLVVAGEIITALADEHEVMIVPVDSEHSAIFQCLVGEEGNPIEKIILTASGGPFRGYTLEQLRQVTKAQALKHPNWEMGAKITIDSASMANKGLEVIEARWLFDVQPEQIEVVVHPQSIIHSIVQFTDGSMKAQMGLPDMRVPIQYGLTYPFRYESNFPRFDFLKYPSLTFESIDRVVFKNLDLAYRALRMGGAAACIFNAANEVSNALFRQERIRFTDIADLNEQAMEYISHHTDNSIEALIACDAETRAFIHAKVK